MIPKTHYLETATHESICVVVSCLAPNSPETPTVLLTHGLAGFVDEPFLHAVKDAYLKVGWRVVAYDARYGFGRGEGPLEKACFSRFIEDMTTMIEWLKTQYFYTGRYGICAHSLGAGAALAEAVRRPLEVAHLVLMAPVYNGEKLLDSYRTHKPDFVAAWQAAGRLERVHPTTPERRGFISWAHMQDACRYHLEEDAALVRAPTLLVYGERDISSTRAINEALSARLIAPHQLLAFPGCNHTFKGHEAALSAAVLKALSSFLKPR